jgi:phenylacetate-CoA ligase
MLNKILFKTAYFLKRRRVISYYNHFQSNQRKPYGWLKNQQEEQLRKLIDFSYKNVPYYAKMFDRIGIGPCDIQTIKDLQKLPILNKQIIKNNWNDFIPKNIKMMEYVNGATGGSTGIPLKYRMSKNDYEKGTAMLYNDWSYGGYQLGDKVAIIAGSSLIPEAKSELKRKIQDCFLNWRHYSSFEMSEKNLFKYFFDINKWKPAFIRGYASSIYLFAKFIEDNNLKVNFRLKGIFTTSEKLFKKQRNSIEKVFNARIFDGYGLNDGGVSASECKRHCGMHINMGRSVMEITNNEGGQIIKGQGKILATSLYNYAMPFIRYDTGDLGVISDAECSCGRKTLLLKKIIGRVTDSLTLNNIIIGSPVLTVLMGRFDIEQYQIIQEDLMSITIKIVQGENYSRKENERFIEKSFYDHVGKINIKFDYVDVIQVKKTEKYRFIINDSKH